MSLFSTISVRRSGEERFVRNTYLAQRQSPVPTPFISPGDGIQYTKTPSCSSITPVLGIRAGLPGNWLVVDEHKVWDYPWRSGDYRKGWRDWESLVGDGGGGLTMFLYIPLLLHPSTHPYPACSFNLQPQKCTCVGVAQITKHVKLICIAPMAQCSPRNPLAKRKKWGNFVTIIQVCILHPVCTLITKVPQIHDI